MYIIPQANGCEKDSGRRISPATEQVYCMIYATISHISLDLTVQVLNAIGIDSQMSQMSIPSTQSQSQVHVEHVV